MLLFLKSVTNMYNFLGDSMLTAVSVSRECGLITPTTPLSQVVVSTTLPYTVQLQPLHSSYGHTEVFFFQFILLYSKYSHVSILKVILFLF
jgi:hypothetical protein